MSYLQFLCALCETLRISSAVNPQAYGVETAEEELSSSLRRAEKIEIRVLLPWLAQKVVWQKDTR